MPEGVRYTKPFLKQVIARVDFVAPIEALQKSLPTRLANAAAAHFPIAEPIDAVSHELNLPAVGEPIHRQLLFKQWNFFGRDREKQVALAAPFSFVAYTNYKGYEDLKDDFGAILETIEKAFPEVRAGRFGLRYINNIEIEANDPVDIWSDLVAGDLLAGNVFFAGRELTRLVHIAELKCGDLSLRLQFGLPNPDYPAVIRRPVFIIDFDAYIQIAHELSSSLQYMDEAHRCIQTLFEQVITDSLRERMR